MLVAQGASAQLCGPTANPCVVGANLVIPSGTIVDLGARDLVIAANKSLTVDGLGLFLVRARNVTLETDAKIIAGGQDGFGGSVSIDASGAVHLKTGSRIDVQSAYGGDIDVTATTFRLDGQLRVSATARDGDGGLLDISTTFDTTIAGQGIQANGGDRFASGGLVDVIAGGNILVSAPISAKGGDGDGGDIDLDAAGNVVTTTTGELTSFATWPFGSGGATTLTAGGGVTIGGPVLARGQGDLLDGGGDGGDLDVVADGGDITVNATIQLDGSAPDGSGGFLDLFATGRVAINAPVSLTAGREGGGGDVLVTGDDVLVNSPLTLQAGFIGGAVDIFASDAVTFTSGGDVDVSATDGPFGEFGGILDVFACSIDVQAGAQLLAVGNGTVPRASIRMRGIHSLRIAGTVQAGGFIELRYKDALPTFVPGFVMIPTPSQVFDTTLPCCVGCNTTTTVIGGTTTTTLVPTACGDGVVGAGEVCDDGNPFDGDCCSSSCQFEFQGLPCADDGNPCTSSRCNGLGLCVHAGDNAGSPCRPVTHACDLTELCTGFSPVCPADASEPDGTACDDDACFDGQLCTDGECGGGVPVTCPTCEACDPDLGCIAAPRPACRQTFLPSKSTLVLKDSASDDNDKLVWKWSKGQTTDLADYGDPAVADGFELCFFDETVGAPVVAGRARMPAGDTCPDKPCWRATSSGWKYADKLGTPNGVSKLLLRAGPDGTALAIVKGKGELLEAPDLPLGASTRVQLRGTDACWEATFSAAGTKRSDDAVFKGASD
jgi:cysteine-rich repeat protein